VAILGSALSVVRHADRLAMRLGEPYGTLILTLSVTLIQG
jgi:Ca2+:H+ antiporter